MYSFSIRFYRLHSSQAQYIKSILRTGINKNVINVLVANRNSTPRFKGKAALFSEESLICKTQFEENWIRNGQSDKQKFAKTKKAKTFLLL